MFTLLMHRPFRAVQKVPTNQSMPTRPPPPTRPATSPPSGPTRLATHNSTPPGLPTHMHRRPTRPATNSRRAAPRNPAAASRPPTLAPTSGAVRGLLAGPAPPFPPPLTRRPHPAPTRPATKSRWWPPGRSWLAGRRGGLCFGGCGCGRVCAYLSDPGALSLTPPPLFPTTPASLLQTPPPSFL